jgi:hypothetical protein
MIQLALTLNFEKWVETCGDELDLYFAESGADREMDFDFEDYAEEMYDFINNEYK